MTLRPICNLNVYTSNMADDTRQSPKEDLSKEALTVDPNYKPFTGEQWQDAKKDYRPPNANMLAGGTQNTAGGKIPEVSITNAFDGGLKVSDFTDLPKKPCVRDALLTGMGAGFAAGGIRAIFGGERDVDYLKLRRNADVQQQPYSLHAVGL